MMHAAYWTLYVLLLAVMLTMLRLPHGAGRPLVGVLAAWPIVLLAVAPNLAAFYAAHRLLFPRFLARRLFGGLMWGAALVCIAAAGIGLVLAYLLFGAAQPAFSTAGEFTALTASMAALAAIHVAVALVMRGFVGWFDDFTIKEELTARTHQMELALVRSRLDPHFLFNTLNNIDVLISRDPAAASRYLGELSEILRFMLYEAKGDAIALADELSYIDKYIALERIRTRNGRYAAHEVIGDPTGLSIAPMTFIPFIENAFKHTEGLKEDGAIVSRIAIDGGRIMFECTNRCRPGAPPPANRGGLGHEIIRRRLELLYPQRHALQAAHLGGTYEVRLTIEGC